MEKSQYTITHQPLSQVYMSATCPAPQSQSQGGCCGKNKCHARRLRVLLPALLALLTIASLAIWLWCSDGLGDLSADVASSLWKRQSSTSSGESSFVKNKLYLIVIFVGLFVCLILAIMLSAWCCKSSFENPLCCPCYLCACCGGLACLECISCGLCCEGLDQIDV
ncbi:unnamed protein product [Rhizoctonia solani]|uniref:Transmembrane protein n=1 Tax=Rhizoctonia solani TaxID=456999 RepID=A0A8H3EEE8_9AGAM|nr:unnamed protein product [Rhizoctonia solani]